MSKFLYLFFAFQFLEMQIRPCYMKFPVLVTGSHIFLYFELINIVFEHNIEDKVNNYISYKIVRDAIKNSIYIADFVDCAKLRNVHNDL